MDTVEAIKVIALRDVLKGGSEYSLRYLFRWYSKTFSTPLHHVQRLDINDLLQAFFEEKFEALDAEDLEEQRRLIFESEDEREKKENEKNAEKAAEDALVEMSKKQNQTQDIGTVIEPPISLADLKTLPENVKMDFVDEQELDSILEGGFANQIKKRTPII